MSKGLNEVRLIGNVGQEPELKYTPSGIAVVTFSLATNKTWKDTDGNKQEKTSWHNIVAWRKLAEIISEYVKKGNRLYIAGEIDYQIYEKEGVKHYATKIVANEMIILSSSKGEGDNNITEQEPPPEQGKKIDDIPF